MRRIAIVGGGLSGMATALLLQSNGFSTILLEAHTQLGGCSGFYPRNGFSFDVGATTLVNFFQAIWHGYLTEKLKWLGIRISGIVSG
jgi:phytoene dehydrogenase-like protein